MCKKGMFYSLTCWVAILQQASEYIVSLAAFDLPLLGSIIEFWCLVSYIQKGISKAYEKQVLYFCNADW